MIQQDGYIAKEAFTFPLFCVVCLASFFYWGYTDGWPIGAIVGTLFFRNNHIENNMTVFEYYDGPEFGAIIIFVIVAIVLAAYRWLKINRKYNGRCPELDRSGRCAIYRTDKEYNTPRF